MRSAPAIAFDYRPSRRIVGYTTLVAVAAGVAPWLCNLPVSARAALSLTALAMGIAALSHFTRARFRRVAYKGAGWMLVDAAHTEHAAELLSHKRLGDWLVLHFRKTGWRRFYVLLGPDNVDVETRRRLILLLARAEVAHSG